MVAESSLTAVSLVRFAREETRLLREGGGWRVLARSGEAFSGWTLRDAAGRRLDGGGFRNGGARIPAPGAAASRSHRAKISGCSGMRLRLSYSFS